MKDEKKVNELKFFDYYPVQTLIMVNCILFVFLDYALTKSYRIYKNLKISKPQGEVIGKKHQVYHHDFIKNGEYHSKSPEYNVYTNSLGFKDRRIEDIVLKSNKKRILFMGDSFTEGFLKKYDDSFVGLISEDLSLDSIEVLNGAVSSYSTSIYWKKIQYLIEKVNLNFDEVMVFIDISDLHDEISTYIEKDGKVVERKTKQLNKKKTGQSSNYIKDKIVFFLKNNFLFTYKVTDFIHDFLRLNRPDRLKYLNNSENPNPWSWLLKPDYFRGNWTWMKFNDSYATSIEEGKFLMSSQMDSLLVLLNENKIKLNVAVYPWPNQIYYNDFNSLHVEIWENWCRENDINFMNFFPKFFNKSQSLRERMLIIEKYYIKADMHFNKAGNILIANEFLNFYKSESKVKSQSF